MALTEDGGMGTTMLVQPANGVNNGFGGFGGGDGWWIILLFILLAGNNGFGNNGGLANGSALYPWMNQTDTINSGFRDQQLSTGIAAINGGIAGLTGAVTNGFAQAEIAANGRQMADMQQMFAVQSALQNCCCENRANIADLKYTVATENCADRSALAQGVQDIIASNNAATQRILDQLCADKIDAKNDTIAQLRQELLYARGQASQDVQTAKILAGQTAEVDALYNRLDACPVGTIPVYGRTPICTCNNCGCNG